MLLQSFKIYIDQDIFLFIICTYLMKNEVTYREFTSLFLKNLKKKREEVFRAVNITEGDYAVKDMLVQLLKDHPNGITYATFINERITFRNSYRRLRLIDTKSSQPVFENEIDDIAKQLDERFELRVEEAESLTMLVSKMKDIINNEKLQNKDSLNDGKQDPSKNLKPQPQPQKNQDKKIKPQGNFRQLDYNKLQVQIRYLETAVDLEGYSYNEVRLKDALFNYIRKYLRQNTITVLRKFPEVRIMDDTSFIKSKEAGNYRFNPFCDAVEIYLKTRDKENFDFNFKVLGNVDQIKITFKKFQPKDWDKNLMSLGPKSSILDLVVYICNKRQAGQLIEALTKALTELGGANIVQDLYGWQRQDYSMLRVKPTFIFEIQELIEQIKDKSQIGSGGRSVSTKKRLCLRIANSHKILRYSVYSCQKQEGVKNIAWLNMENLKEAISIVSQQIYNKELLDQLGQYFNQFALNPDGKPISFSRGLVLYGPPGTGKTVLSEALPNIIGFHLIECGLSAADFMKSLVGESSRMIRDLVNRAAVSPYLLCSLAIDEVDGLVPDRKDKDEKNKGEGISMLLSVIGGNKDVSNLVFMTSTNYLKKIDEAIRRRLSGQYQVGRPNPWARQQIIKSRCDYFNTNGPLLSHVIKITTNFTGAALNGLANFLLKTLKIKIMNKKPADLSKDEITEATILIARQYSIKLGVYTLPEIYNGNQDKKFIFSESFLEKISNHFMIVKYIKDNDFSIMYATETRRFSQGKVIPIYEKEEDKINISVERKNDFDSFNKFIEAIFPIKKYDIKSFRQSDYPKYQDYKEAITKLIKDNDKKRLKSQKTVLIIQDYKNNQGDTRFKVKLFDKKHKNLYIFFYLLPGDELNSFVKNTLVDWKQPGSGSNQQTYTGRIMVELNNETRMAFQLNSSIQSESKVAFKLFLKSQESSSPKAVIPELVDFFTKQQVSYILLIDYELLLQNDAFEEKKILQVMEQKMMEAKNYERVAVIINLDSMIMLNENASDSNFGRSMSYSIQNYNLYQILLSYMREFAIISGRTSRWMTVIGKHPELISIAKKHLDWPLYPQEIEKQHEEELKEEEKQCVRCRVIYTERSNQEERKCMQHPGRIIDTRTKAFDNSSPEKLMARKYQQKKEKSGEKDKEDDRYVYACCLKNLSEQGCQNFYHLEQSQLQSKKNDLEIQRNKEKSIERWNNVLKYFQEEA